MEYRAHTSTDDTLRFFGASGAYKPIKTKPAVIELIADKDNSLNVNRLVLVHEDFNLANISVQVTIPING
jgi:hypothetical protein